MNPSIGRSALILASGDDVPCTPWQLVNDDVVVICADGGARLARAWGITPQIILGDQDSLDEATEEYWQSKTIPFQRVSAVKDQTDMDLAVDYALGQGATSITLVGGWGSRIDHALGNVELLYRLALGGVQNWLLTKEHRLSAFCKEFRAKVNLGSVVSLIPLSPEVLRVSTTGLLYPLHGVTLHKGSTLTISNVDADADISVRIADGVLLAILQ
ncbi:MAG TPA: thiamine diphosphokinase [Firmicutes bacterium]|nr:thiamine diphosphokinase [Bacillota bacterium]